MTFIKTLVFEKFVYVTLMFQGIEPNVFCKLVNENVVELLFINW